MNMLARRGIPIIVADDHPIVREGLQTILEADARFEVVAQAHDAASLLRIVRSVAARVLLLDLSMPGSSGIDSVTRVNAVAPQLSILVYTGHSDTALAERALRAGASGYVTKDADPDELLRACERVARGERYLSQPLAQQLALGAVDALECDAVPLHRLLSERELQVLQHIVSGLPQGEVARRLSLSPKTVSTHKTRAMRKLGVDSTAALFRVAQQLGLLPQS